MKNLPTMKKSKIKISKFLTKLKDDSKLQEYHDRHDIIVPRLWDSIENSNRFFNDRPN